MFYLKTKGDYYRYLTQSTEGARREGNFICKVNIKIFHEGFHQ